MLCALNTDAQQARAAWVVVDHELNEVGRQYRCLYSTDPAKTVRTLTVEERGGCRCVELSVPAGGVVIFEQA